MLFEPGGTECSSGALMQAYTEIRVMLDNLRHSRDSLRQAASERLRHTTEKLREVTSVTEQAATDILDRLDGALLLVDELDGLDASGSEAAAAARNRLRDELYVAQGGLQFQDIAAQQLAHATQMIEQIEVRLASVAELLDPRALVASSPALAAEPEESQSLTFAPTATMSNSEARQALADRIFEAPAA